MNKLVYPKLRNGLVGAWCPSIDRSRSTLLIDQSGYGNHGTLTGGMDPATDWVASDGKVALDFDGSGDYVSTTLTTVQLQFACTVSIWMKPLKAAASTQREFLWGTGNLAVGTFDFQAFSDTNLYVGWFDLSPSVNYRVQVSKASAGWTPDIWQNFTFRSGSFGSEIYRNGRLVGSNATAPTGIPFTTETIQIGANNVAAANPFWGQIDDVRFYNRSLTPSEISTLAQRRGIAYETYRVPIVRGASGGGTTVTPTTAALVLTTFEPTVSITTTVVPTTTALVLTTFAPVVTTPQAITPTTAALTLTPFAATVSTPTLITPPEIDLTLTGYSPDIFTPILVTPTIVGLITTTFEPTITISADKIVIPTTLDLTLTTFAPNVALGGNQTATPTTVTLSLTTFSPTVTTSNAVEVVPDTNALTITTYAPTVSAPVTVTPGVLALTLTSYSATIVNPVTVTPTTRSLTLTTYAPNLGEEVVSNFNYYYMMIQGV